MSKSNFLVCAGLVFIAATPAPLPQERATAHLTAIINLYGPNWIKEEREPAGLKRALPKLHTYCCRLRARGAYPFAKVLVTHSGKVLANIPSKEIFARAAQEKIEVKLVENKWQSAIKTKEGRTFATTIAAMATYPGFRAKDAGQALTITSLFLDFISIKGQFVAATVDRGKDNGYRVKLTWQEGTTSYGYKEKATWLFRFGSNGRLLGASKKQLTFKRQGRR